MLITFLRIIMFLFNQAYSVSNLFLQINSVQCYKSQVGAMSKLAFSYMPRSLCSFTLVKIAYNTHL